MIEMLWTLSHRRWVFENRLGHFGTWSGPGGYWYEMEPPLFTRVLTGSAILPFNVGVDER